MKTYHELILFPTFEERFNYLKLKGSVGEETFGFDRYFNQKFYHSKEWRDIRNYVIARDQGCDLAIPDREIFENVLIHHMNPISIDDIRNGTDFLLNPEYLITTVKSTHDAIHYGLEIPRDKIFVERRAGDTCLWR